MPVNPRLAPLPSPGSWVNRERCEGCGASYAEHRGDYSFRAAVQYLRGAAKSEGDDGGGYRSRGAVLWALRVLKINDWFAAHSMCREPVPF